MVKQSNSRNSLVDQDPMSIYARSQCAFETFGKSIILFAGGITFAILICCLFSCAIHLLCDRRRKQDRRMCLLYQEQIRDLEGQVRDLDAQLYSCKYRLQMMQQQQFLHPGDSNLLTRSLSTRSGNGDGTSVTSTGSNGEIIIVLRTSDGDSSVPVNSSGPTVLNAVLQQPEASPGASSTCALISPSAPPPYEECIK